jgi:hypothetical protein
MTWRQVPLVTGSATNFFGWLDDSGTPFISLVIMPATGSPAAYGFSRRLRSRIAAARPRA